MDSAIFNHFPNKHARYKSLEQALLGAGISVAAPRSFLRAAKGGVKFYGSRPYQSGDRLKVVDWKHSFMLGELIVKEFAWAQGRVGIIVADLTAKDAKAADELAYDFVMSALTLATESLPSALAVYNQNEVLAATSLMDPRETLKKVLGLTERITVVEPEERVLQPTETRMLKRSIALLSLANTESAREFSEFLKFELEANQETAKKHPGTEVLAKATGSVQGPAVIVVASPMSGDCYALLLALEMLKEKGYGIVMAS